MAVDITLLNSNSLENIQTNFDRVEVAFEEALGRGGDLPNSMNANLDMNSNSILNVSELDVDSLTIQGLPVGQFNGTYKGLWNSVSTYVVNDVVRDDSGNLWIAKQTNTNSNPVEGADWTLFMPVSDGITDGDKTDITVSGSGTIWTLNDSIITSNHLTDTFSELQAMALKLGVLSDGDVNLYVNPLGDDTTGDGTIGNPFATPQRAWDSLPAIINHKYVINIADGTYTTSSRPAASMQRPALIHCDQKKTGLRSDAPGGVLTASVVFRGESKAGVILQPGSANGYVTGVYQTGATGMVGFQNFTVDCQPGSVSGMTCHRPGNYMHVLDVDIDGNMNTTFGMLSESKAMLEAVNVTIHHCPVGVQMISQSVWQSGLASDITDCTTGMTVTDASWGGLSAASQCSSPVLVQGGGTFDTSGQSGFRVKVNSNVTIRDGNWEGAYVDITGTITTYPGARVNLGAMGWSGSWNDYGGSLYIPGCKSYIAPATQSNVFTPLSFFGEVRNLYVDNTFELRNNAGNVVAENFGVQQATIAANGDTIPITMWGKHTVVNVYAAGARTSVVMPQFQSGRFSNTPFPDGAKVTLVAFSGSATIQISPGSTSLLEGGTVTLGTASGRSHMTFIYSASRGRWVGTRGDNQP